MTDLEHSSVSLNEIFKVRLTALGSTLEWGRIKVKALPRILGAGLFSFIRSHEQVRLAFK